MTHRREAVRFDPRVMQRTAYVCRTQPGPTCPCCGQRTADIEVSHEEAIGRVVVQLIIAIENDLKARSIIDTTLFKIKFTTTKTASGLGKYKIVADVSEKQRNGIPFVDAVAFAKEVALQWQGGDTTSYLPHVARYVT